MNSSADESSAIAVLHSKGDACCCRGWVWGRILAAVDAGGFLNGVGGQGRGGGRESRWDGLKIFREGGDELKLLNGW